MLGPHHEVGPPVVAADDFSGIRTLVDVGGSRGHALVPILRAYPTMRAVLFDLPHVIERARPVLTEAGLADRCQLVGASFFGSAPSGADAYRLNHVIHDGDDERSVAKTLPGWRTAPRSVPAPPRTSGPVS